METMNDLPGVHQGCVPRTDIIEGAYELEAFAADLNLVIEGKKGYLYSNPDDFFKNTYPTDGLKTTVKEVFGRLTSTHPGAPVIKLETGLGGGKTHTLIALYHLAKHGTKINDIERVIGDLNFEPMLTAAIVGTELGISTQEGKRKTLWGELAYQLKGYDGYDFIKQADQQMVSPGERDLRELFGEDKCLILIDEIAQYLVRASGISIGETTLAENTVAFLHALTQVAAALDNVELVITSLDEKSVFKEKTGKIREMLEKATHEEMVIQTIKDANSVVSRVVQSLEPTKGEEFAHIIRHRLFESIDSNVRDNVVDAYLEGYRKEGVSEYLPQSVKDPLHRDVMIKSYPFHPDIISILRTKTSSIENFHKTRGVLRFLSVLVKHVWDDKIETPLIHPYHVDFSNDVIFNELISRLDLRDLKPAIDEDLANKDKDTRSDMVNQKYSNPYGTWVTTTILLHSLTGMIGTDVKKGANPAEIHEGLYQPGLDPEIINRVLEDLDNTWFFFDKHGQNYVCGLQPRLNKIVEEAKDQVEKTKINSELETRIRDVFRSKVFFRNEFFPSGPEKVSDDTDTIKLVLIHYNDEKMKFGQKKIPELVRNIFEQAGTQGKPRSFINSLVFSVADVERINHMEVNARKFLALKQLIEDYESGASYLSGLSPEQVSRLKNMKKESELYLSVAIITAYKHLIVPTAQAGLDDEPGRRPLRILSMRDNDHDVEMRVKAGHKEEEHIVQFLKDQLVAKTADDKQLAPDRIIDSMWKKTVSSIPGDDFKKMFYKQPIAGIHFSPELIRKSMRDGVRDNKWYATIGERFYDSKNYQMFNPSFTSEVMLTLVHSDEGKALHDQFYCNKCGNRKDECECKGEEPPQPPTPSGGDVDTGGFWEPPKPELVFSKSNMGLKRIHGDLTAWVEDKKIDRIERVKFVARSRKGLSILSRALVQFTQKKNILYDVNGGLQDLTSGLQFEITYKGNEDGFNKLKPAIVDFMPNVDFDFKELKVMIEFEEPIGANNFAQILGERIAEFTDVNPYDIEVKPLEE